MDVSRRKFFKICAGGMAGTTAAALGFAPKMALAQARNFKLLRAKEIRNTCTYCSVGCGLLMYSLGDGAKNAKEAIYHIEGDPDHPVSRGALCPKGAGLLDYVHSENRLRYPQYRAPGSDKWQRISWDDAFNRIARLMKADRDANFIEKNEQITELLNSAYAALNTNLDTWNTWLKNTLLPSMQNIVSGAAIGVLNVVTVAKNLIIGIIVAVYMLASRKRFVQQGKLVLHSIVRPRWAQLITEEVKYADKMFGGFINGKIMDSAIIGVLCYIGCLIFKFPSALLVSVIIGVTNVIPFFGPFIGAIPATLLILIQSPIKALWFVLFVLVLQQLDGNIIGPKILGNTTGLSSFWVLFAILLFGGLWGFVGMIVGVPLFAVIYDVIKKLVIHGLQRNQELTLLNSYHDQFGDPTDDAAAQPAAPQPAENQ